MPRRKRLKVSSTSTAIYELIGKLMKLARRQRQNENIKLILQNENKWRSNGAFELELTAEMEAAEQLEFDLSKLINSVRDPNENSITDRLTDRYYEPVTLQILSLTHFHSGSILAQTVFDRISSRDVATLVTGLISNPTRHHALSLLHYAFDPVYWKQRYETIRRTCYLYERIKVPPVIGLVQFADLISRHTNLLARKSKTKDVTIKDIEIYDKMVGNHYFLHYSGWDDTVKKHKGISLGEIAEVGNDSLDDGLILPYKCSLLCLRQLDFLSALGDHDGPSVADHPITTHPSKSIIRFILMEPFLIRHKRDPDLDLDDLEASFIPDSPVKFESISTLSGLRLPSVADHGNFKNAQKRILPAITTNRIDIGHNRQTEVITLHLIQLAKGAETTTTAIVLDAFTNDLEDYDKKSNVEFSIDGFAVSLTHTAVLTAQFHPGKKGTPISQCIFLITLADQTVKKVVILSPSTSMQWRSDIHLSAGAVFYKRNEKFLWSNSTAIHFYRVDFNRNKFDLLHKYDAMTQLTLFDKFVYAECLDDRTLLMAVRRIAIDSHKLHQVVDSVPSAGNSFIETFPDCSRSRGVKFRISIDEEPLKLQIENCLSRTKS